VWWRRATLVLIASCLDHLRDVNVALMLANCWVVLPSSAVAEEIYVGNVMSDTAARGWLLGHFMAPGDARHSEAVEIKWGVHPAGEQRSGWVTDDPRSILSVLISGRFRIDLPDRSVVLAKQGDYIVFHGVNHTWQAEEESVVVSVRWPSLPGYDQVGQEGTSA
jgi:hypothetical protein